MDDREDIYFEDETTLLARQKLCSTPRAALPSETDAILTNVVFIE